MQAKANSETIPRSDTLKQAITDSTFQETKALHRQSLSITIYRIQSYP